MKKNMVVSCEIYRCGEKLKAFSKKDSKIMGLRLITAAIIFFGSFALADPAYTQTLNDSVNAQLESFPISGVNVPCGRLFEAGGVPAPGSGLETICSRGVPSGTPPPTQTTGGGQGAATTRPSIVEKRLKEARDEEKTEEGKPDKELEELEYGKFGVYLSGEYENLNKDTNKFEDGYHSIIRRMVVGADAQLTKRVLAGLAFDTHGQDGRFDAPVGKFNVDSYRFVAYGSLVPTSNMYLQVSANYGITSAERKRGATFTDENGNVTQGVPHADFDADLYGAYVSAGYGFSFGPVTLSPRAGYEWQRIAYENYRESGSSGLELKYDKFNITSSLSTLGLMGSYAISTRFGVLVPQASFDWKHQFDLDQQKLDVSFVDDTQSVKFKYQNEEPDRDYYEINAGLVFVMPNGFQAFGNYRTLTGNSLYDSDAYTLGLRYSF